MSVPGTSERSRSTRRRRSRLMTWWPCTRLAEPHTAQGRAGRPTTLWYQSCAISDALTRSERLQEGQGWSGHQTTVHPPGDGAGNHFPKPSEPSAMLPKPTEDERATLPR
jgi:hypothetical protein